MAVFFRKEDGPMAALVDSLPFIASSYLNITAKKVRREVEKVEDAIREDDGHSKVTGFDGKNELTLVVFRSQEEVFFSFVVSTV